MTGKLTKAQARLLHDAEMVIKLRNQGNLGSYEMSVAIWSLEQRVATCRAAQAEHERTNK